MHSPTNISLYIQPKISSSSHILNDANHCLVSPLSLLSDWHVPHSNMLLWSIILITRFLFTGMESMQNGFVDSDYSPSANVTALNLGTSNNHGVLHTLRLFPMSYHCRHHLNECIHPATYIIQLIALTVVPCPHLPVPFQSSSWAEQKSLE